MPMETIRIVIDASLLREVDQAAGRAGVSRSEFVCEAVREYLKLYVNRNKKSAGKKVSR
jgi:metal-responsive CopG/Arc/MetJ family transcriptional regulator